MVQGGGQIPEEALRQARSEPCFPGETLVQSPTGLRAIGEVLVGDAVLCWDFDTRAAVESVVVSVGEYVGSNPIYHVHDAATDDTFEVSPGHLFRVGGKWVALEHLGEKFTCETMTGTDVVLTVTPSDRDSAEKVYNLRVRQHHNYLVGSRGIIVRDY